MVQGTHKKVSGSLMTSMLPFITLNESWIQILNVLISTRRGKPRWLQTLHRLASLVFFLVKKRRRKKITHGMQHMIPVGRWTFSQNFRSPAHTVWELRCFEDLEEKDKWLHKLISDKGVSRTAQATPGLLITTEHYK